jgi:hypothetical protein
MFGVRMTRRGGAALTSILVVLAAVLASGVVAGQFRADPQSFHDALGTGEITRVADVASSDGLPGRGVFAQLTDAGQFCLFDAPSESSPLRQGGCNPADDPLGGSALSVSLAYEGGPGVESVRDARLIGLASPSVAQVQVLMSDGTRRNVRTKQAAVGSKEFLAFGYRFKKSDLRRGIGPIAVIASDARGIEIERTATGIAG